MPRSHVPAQGVASQQKYRSIHNGWWLQRPSMRITKRTPARCALQKGLRITKRAEPIADRRRADRGAVAGRPRHNRVPSTARYRRAIAIYIHSTTTISTARAYIQISNKFRFAKMDKNQKPRALKS